MFHSNMTDREQLMSSSDIIEPGLTKTLVKIDAPPGVEIQVIDGDYHIINRAIEKSEVNLDQGIYLIRWLAADNAYEQIVRLLPSDRELQVNIPDEFARSTRVEPVEAQALVSTGRRTPKAKALSGIVVIERSGDKVSEGSRWSEMRLYDKDEVAMQSTKPSLEPARPETNGGYAIAVYQLSPGNYRLRYEASTGMSLDQTIVAFADRRTFVFFTQEGAYTLVASENAYERQQYIGVNPEKTVIVTIPTSVEAVHPDDLRVSEILLHAIAFGGDPLDRNMMERVTANDADPLLRLYAATLIIAQLERKASPGLDDPYPLAESDGETIGSFESRWTNRALDLIKKIDPPDASPDLISLRWHLSGSDGLSLTAPPMLVGSWASAARFSVSMPDSLPDTPSFRAASRGRVDAGPWLVWRATAAKEGTLGVREVDSSASELSDAVTEFASSLSSLHDVGLDKERSANQRLDALSPDTRGLISAALNVDLGSSVEGNSEKAEQLAGSLLTSAAQLVEKLKSASVEIDKSANETKRTRFASQERETEGNRAVPALRLPILHFDDPQKGRFGGQSTVDGFALTASFAETADPKWVSITLTVVAKPSVKGKLEKAEFFLHDTFNPSRAEAPFVGRKAELILQAFGGFTVGVWISSHQVELELDLASLDYAPTVIKEW